MRACLVPVYVCVLGASVRVCAYGCQGVRDCVYSSEVERERGCMCEGETERVREC